MSKHERNEQTPAQTSVAASALKAQGPVVVGTERGRSTGVLRRIKKGPWLLLAILAIAAFLRLHALGSESLWLDEAFSVVWCKTSLVAMVRSTITSETHPPLYYILLHFWMLAFGQSEAAVRSLSACFGILSVLLLYHVGRELFDRKVGLLASFFLAVLPSPSITRKKPGTAACCSCSHCYRSTSF